MDEQRLFIRQGRRHHRKHYSMGEVRAGIAVLGALATLAAWVVWKGAHPDPELFSAMALEEGKGETRRGDRGPLPAAIAPAGFTVGRVSHFGPDTLYEKINGREGFYKGFGFERLTFASLQARDDETRAIDVEAYDLGSGAGAHGAFVAERPPPGSIVQRWPGAYTTQNALFVVRGRHYVRALGSDDAEPTRAALLHVRQALVDGLRGEELPWAYTLLRAAVGGSVDDVSYQPEAAFSFSFARDVFSAAFDGDAEMFVTARPSDDDATAFAQALNEGFASYGTPTDKGSADGLPLIANRFIGTLAGARAVGPFVIGVRGAADATQARKGHERLRAALQAMTSQNRAAAVARARRLLGDGDGDGAPQPPTKGDSGGGVEER